MNRVPPQKGHRKKASSEMIKPDILQTDGFMDSFSRVSRNSSSDGTEISSRGSKCSSSDWTEVSSRESRFSYRCNSLDDDLAESGINLGSIDTKKMQTLDSTAMGETADHEGNSSISVSIIK